MENNELINSLKKHAYFNKFEDKQLKELLEHSKLVNFNKSELLCTQGDMPKSVYFLVDGLVKIFIEGRFSKTQIVSIVPPNNIAGLFSMFGNRQCQFSMSTLAASQVLVFDRDHFQSFLDKRPDLLAHLTHYISDVGGDLMAKLILFNQKNIKGKVAYVLLFLYNALFKVERFHIPFSRKEYAQLAGMSTENVIRTLSEFNKEGLIKIRNRDVEILDVDFLNKIANYG